MPVISAIIIILVALHAAWTFPGTRAHPGVGASPAQAELAWIEEAGFDGLLGLSLAGYLLLLHRSRAREKHAAQRNAHLLNLVATSADNLILLVNGRGERLYASANCERFLGYSAEEYLSAPYDDMLSPEDRQALGQAWKSLTKAIPYSEITHRLTRKDRSVIWVRTRFYRSIDPIKGDVRLLVVLNDITERRAAENALAAREALFRSMFDALPDRLFVHAIRDDGGFAVEMLNKAAEREFRLNRDRISSETLEELLPLPLAAPLSKGLRDCAAVGEMTTTEESRLAELGKTELEFIRVPIRDEAGTVTRIFVSGRDIADRKLRERELAQARDMADEASKVKSEFLANMSHELRTPLNAVIGFSGLIEMQADLLPGQERLKSYATDIRTSGEYLLALINDILDFSKADAGHLALVEEDVDLVAMTASCIRMMAPTAEENNIRIALTGPDTLYARCDERRLRQVVLNLLSNGIKFTPPNGRVTVAIDGTNGPTIEVKDTGIGIVAANLSRVMEPFTQVENARNRRHEGTGLGLPISKKIAEIHGGKLSLVSTIDVGTSVTLHLPKSRARPDLDAAERDLAEDEDVRILQTGTDAPLPGKIIPFPPKYLSSNNN